MAAHLSKHLKPATIAALCAGIGAGAPAAADLPDPTRPPAALGAAREDGQDAPAALELQSVLISPQRRVAIVSGREVRVGDRIGDARVVRIAENELVLRNGQDMQVLKLFPQVEKKRAVPGRTGTMSPLGSK